jgi:CheY-like chemotaxis protein
MNERVLCVDDDPNVLAGYQRGLRKQWHLETASSGQAALGLLETQGPYAVIVADMQMPGMNGVELLTRARTLAPDTVRIMLTGNADQKTAVEAVNEGHVFRFLNKPCSAEMLALVLDAAVRQYRLVVAERELLEKTLSGSVKILTEILSLQDPRTFGHRPSQWGPRGSVRGAADPRHSPKVAPGNNVASRSAVRCADWRRPARWTIADSDPERSAASRPRSIR